MAPGGGCVAARGDAAGDDGAVRPVAAAIRRPAGLPDRHGVVLAAVCGGAPDDCGPAPPGPVASRAARSAAAATVVGGGRVVNTAGRRGGHRAGATVAR